MHYSADSSISFDIDIHLKSMNTLETRINNLEDELDEKKSFLTKTLVKLVRYIYNNANKDIGIFSHLYSSLNLNGEHITRRAFVNKDLFKNLIDKYKSLTDYRLDNYEIVKECEQCGSGRYLWFNIQYVYYDHYDDTECSDSCGSYCIPVDWIELWVVGGISKLGAQLREKYEYMKFSKKAAEQESKRLADERKIQKEKEDKDKRYQEYLKLKEEFGE